MKKQLSVLLILSVFCTLCSFAQLSGTLDKMAKQGSANLSNATNEATQSALNKLEIQLKNQFHLEAVKAEITGESLKLKVAESDLSKSSAVTRTKQGTAIALAAKNILLNGDIDLKKMNVNTVLVEIFKNINLKEIIDTIRVKL
ncbi:MAG: hypothetical protein H7296_15420 [Bacteroidia bacterium]|nr:hypothetical protein [Bacteroidia bacterium]